jgi:hypothetical protein
MITSLAVQSTHIAWNSENGHLYAIPMYIALALIAAMYFYQFVAVVSDTDESYRKNYQVKHALWNIIMFIFATGWEIGFVLKHEALQDGFSHVNVFENKTMGEAGLYLYHICGIVLTTAFVALQFYAEKDSQTTSFDMLFPSRLTLQSNKEKQQQKSSNSKRETQDTGVELVSSVSSGSLKKKQRSKSMGPARVERSTSRGFEVIKHKPTAKGPKRPNRRDDYSAV